MFVNKSNKHTDVLRFIELYRSHEVLWNMNLSSYRRNDLKMKAYKAIGAEANLSVEKVKKKIKSLRTAYSAEKAKVETSKNSGCDADSVYIPSVFWYNDMNFLDAFLNRRKTVDSCSKEYVGAMVEASLDSEPNDCSLSYSYPSCSKKRSYSPEPKSKLDEALEKLVAINKGVSAFEAFGESVGRQLKEFPEIDAYQVMADIQSLLSNRKIGILRKKVAEKTKIVQVEVLNHASRSPTPLSQNSNSIPSSDALYCAMSDADIFKEDCKSKVYRQCNKIIAKPVKMENSQ